MSAHDTGDQVIGLKPPAYSLGALTRPGKVTADLKYRSLLFYRYVSRYSDSRDLVGRLLNFTKDDKYNFDSITADFYNSLEILIPVGSSIALLVNMVLKSEAFYQGHEDFSKLRILRFSTYITTRPSLSQH